MKNADANTKWVANSAEPALISCDSIRSMVGVAFRSFVWPLHGSFDEPRMKPGVPANCGFSLAVQRGGEIGVFWFTGSHHLIWSHFPSRIGQDSSPTAPAASLVNSTHKDKIPARGGYFHCAIWKWVSSLSVKCTSFEKKARRNCAHDRRNNKQPKLCNSCTSGEQCWPK